MNVLINVVATRERLSSWELFAEFGSRGDQINTSQKAQLKRVRSERSRAGLLNIERLNWPSRSVMI
jgi:hypothetical protein